MRIKLDLPIFEAVLWIVPAGGFSLGMGMAELQNE